MPRFFALAMMLVLAAAPVPAGAEAERKTPYWASIAAGKALMRTGPGKNYPAVWLYQRADLPIRVVEVYSNWRRIQDSEGAAGWMLVNLLSDTRTALVTGGAPQPIYAEASTSAKITWRLAPGVVGRISRCKGQWCLIDIKGKRGYIQKAHFWGVDPGEEF
jgi:SH3-like domain-containing protein